MNDCVLLTGADDEVGRWVVSRIDGFDNWIPGMGRSLGFTYGERLIAGASFFRDNGINCEVAFASEDPRWLNRESLRLLFEYPFRQLKLRRLTAIADSGNHASLKLIEALGFTQEATLLRATEDGDLIVFRLLAEDCRWLSH